MPQHRTSLRQILDYYHDADTPGQLVRVAPRPSPHGHPGRRATVLCEARLRPTAGWDALEIELDELYERADADEDVWHEFADIDDDERLIRAVLRRRDGELEVEVNSEPRLNRVLAQLTDVAEVVSQTTRPVETLKQMNEMLADSPPAQAPPPPDPELAAGVRDRMERRWLDEGIPALAVMTPRQAAADPTRNEDLIALLRSFEDSSRNELSMRPEVIREELGLED